MEITISLSVVVFPSFMSVRRGNALKFQFKKNFRQTVNRNKNNGNNIIVVAVIVDEQTNKRTNWKVNRKTLKKQNDLMSNFNVKNTRKKITR